jgi:hypothetical protein
VKTFTVLAVVALSFALAPAIPQERPVPAGGSTALKPAKSYRVVDLKRGSFVIDEPGNWVLNRSWTFESSPDLAAIIIDVVADEVVLDFRGFALEVTGLSGIPSTTLVNVRGNSFVLKNAELNACCEGGLTLRSTGRATVIEGLRGFSFDGVALEGDEATIRDSVFHARFGVGVASRSVIVASDIGCRSFCVGFAGDGNQLLNSRITAFDVRALRINGNGNVLAGNFINQETAVGPHTTFDVRGDRNILRDNTIVASGEVNVIFDVLGTENVIDHNVAAGTAGNGRAQVGVRFGRDGNFYGDNRMAAGTPFQVGGTLQKDWGGNVGY